MLSRSPTNTGCLKTKALTATVATRPPARRVAGTEPAMSTWAMIQPPKTSPCRVASLGSGMTRNTGCRSAGRVLRVSVLTEWLQVEGAPAGGHGIVARCVGRLARHGKGRDQRPRILPACRECARHAVVIHGAEP